MKFIDSFGIIHENESSIRLNTKADKIRSMTDDEMAEQWCKWAECWHCPVYKDCTSTTQDCKKLVLEWLKSPAT